MIKKQTLLKSAYAISGILVLSTGLLNTQALAQVNLGVGKDETVIPAEVSEGRDGTDIRFKTSGTAYHYTNGPANPAVVLTENNPAASDKSIQDQTRMTKTGDSFTFLDRYEIESPDSEAGTLSYNIKLFCTTGCESVGDYLTVDKVINHWSSVDSDKLDKSQTLSETQTTVNKDGTLNISVTPFNDCQVKDGICGLNNKIKSPEYSLGQFGWVSVTLKLKQDVADKPIIIDGFSTMDYSAFGSVRGNTLRAWIGSRPETTKPTESKESVINPMDVSESSSSQSSTQSEASSQPTLPKTGGEENKTNEKSVNPWILPTTLFSMALAISAYIFFKTRHRKAKFVK